MNIDITSSIAPSSDAIGKSVKTHEANIEQLKNKLKHFKQIVSVISLTTLVMLFITNAKINYLPWIFFVALTVSVGVSIVTSMVFNKDKLVSVLTGIGAYMIAPIVTFGALNFNFGGSEIALKEIDVSIFIFGVPSAFIGLFIGTKLNSTKKQINVQEYALTGLTVAPKSTCLEVVEWLQDDDIARPELLKLHL